LALAHLKKLLDPEVFAKVHLIMAGGYNTRLPENNEHFEEVQQVVEENQL